MAENEKSQDLGSGNNGSIGVNDENSVESGTPSGNGEVSRTEEDIAAEILRSRQKNPNPPSEDEKRLMVAEYVQQAIVEGLVAYDVYAIEKKYPKAYNALLDFIAESANLPVDIDTVVGIMFYSGRTVVFSFFDKHKIFVNIIGSDNIWTYSFEPTSRAKTSYKTRVDCEVAAFMEAFAELEKQLSYKS